MQILNIMPCYMHPCTTGGSKAPRLPPTISRKEACINVLQRLPGTGDDCFCKAVLVSSFAACAAHIAKSLCGASALFPAINRNRVHTWLDAWRDYGTVVFKKPIPTFSSLQLPMELSRIQSFETSNAHFRVLVLGCTEGGSDLNPLYIPESYSPF